MKFNFARKNISSGKGRGAKAAWKGHVLEIIRCVS
eukprot:CAMPEP_0172736022 /NCGR_PEP_ID=MMETSP1074-20121228/113978_1 /TAXON_ID=2916 /ORGANISM="Ceratium fusus, Strain PA161109" /LENGTH=34 /DNA_ID= /DNA_START= /DNA_END= /DNA_ORIENTATION=